MENKEKQITEMTRAMCFQAKYCIEKSCVQINCEKTWLAEKLYNAGYRKCPEDSVVLSREEYEKLKKLSKDTNQIKSSALEGLYMSHSDIENIVAQSSKETAEKWYNKVKHLYLENVGEQVFEHNWFGIQINKFAKQCGIKIKE